MPLVMPTAALQKMLEFRLDITAPEALSLRLYINNVTPVTASATGDFTVATFTGYVNVTLDDETWTMTPGATTIAEYNTAVEFEASAGSQDQDVYGYFIVGVTSGTLLWAERFPDGPYNIDASGDKVSITPRITLANAGA